MHRKNSKIVRYAENKYYAINISVSRKKLPGMRVQTLMRMKRENEPRKYKSTKRGLIGQFVATRSTITALKLIKLCYVRIDMHRLNGLCPLDTGVTIPGRLFCPVEYSAIQ